MAATAAEALSLYRSFLRVARDFPHYNIREYIKRRAGDGFRRHAGEGDPEAISSALERGKTDLSLARRQSLLYAAYETPHRSVLDLKPGKQ